MYVLRGRQPQFPIFMSRQEQCIPSKQLPKKSIQHYGIAQSHCNTTELLQRRVQTRAGVKLHSMCFFVPLSRLHKLNALSSSNKKPAKTYSSCAVINADYPGGTLGLLQSSSMLQTAQHESSKQNHESSKQNHEATASSGTLTTKSITFPLASGCRPLLVPLGPGCGGGWLG